MNPRLRLALFLAALALAGPIASGRAIEATRVEVSIARFDSERSLTPRVEESYDAFPAAGLATRDFEAEHTAPVLSLVLPHSLYQRPPPLQN